MYELYQLIAKEDELLEQVQEWFSQLEKATDDSVKAILKLKIRDKMAEVFTVREAIKKF